jgi:hypothetical protein
VNVALALLACWQPEPFTPPPPPEEARAALGLPAGEDVVEGGGVTGGAEPPPSQESAEAPQPALNPDPDGFDAYPATVVRTPATVVDDAGRPLCVVDRPGVAVEVRGEEPIRVRVRLASCGGRPAEGWLQPEMVARVP